LFEQFGIVSSAKDHRQKPVKAGFVCRNGFDDDGNRPLKVLTVYKVKEDPCRFCSQRKKPRADNKDGNKLSYSKELVRALLFSILHLE
jgi:hypothetical protein